MQTAITNIDELRTEIERLRLKKQFQKNELKQHFNSPLSTFNAIRLLFHRDKKDIKPFTSHADIFTWLSKTALPFTLNKTLFRKSSIIIKWLVRMLSRKVAPQINKKSVNSFWEKLRSFIPRLKRNDS